MHWVDRGPAPTGVASYKSRYTQRWVDYYRHDKGNRPNDDYWRRFKPDLEAAFSGLCAYCENGTKGQIDHFRPKSRWPELVYHWSNWLFACSDCNNGKSDKWPICGYVNPCAETATEIPENYFDFNFETGEILPKDDLSPTRYEKARKTIDDLGLNDAHQMRKRLNWLELVAAAIPTGPVGATLERIKLRERLTSRSEPLSSITRAWLRKYR